jgi:hypothetical protein
MLNKVRILEIGMGNKALGIKYKPRLELGGTLYGSVPTECPEMA